MMMEGERAIIEDDEEIERGTEPLI